MAIVGKAPSDPAKLAALRSQKCARYGSLTRDLGGLPGRFVPAPI